MSYIHKHTLCRLSYVTIKMATKRSSVSSNSRSTNQQPSVTSQQELYTPKPDDFVDKTDEDYYCPVSMELLTQPHQTDCCGNHISKEAANRLIKEKKPCPTCKKETLATHADLYFARKVRQLKVRCPHKKSGCEWTGELGDFNQHTTSCPMCPWNCSHCKIESIHDKRQTDHAPQCEYQLVPCPNDCEIGTVPRCNVEKHLRTCPLQLVECEFTNFGCDVRVPRKDLASHMTEKAQEHLKTVTLLNLRRTRDLHWKIEQQNEQISQLETTVTTELQQLDKKIDTTKFQKVDTKLQQLSSKLSDKFQKVDSKLQQHHTAVDTKLQKLDKKIDSKFQQIDTKLQELDSKIEKIETTVKLLHTKNEAMLQELDTKVFQKVDTILQRLDTNPETTTDKPLPQAEAGLYGDLQMDEFTCHELTITNITECQKRGEARRWESIPISNTPNKHSFLLAVYTGKQRTHLSVFLSKNHTKNKTEGAAFFHLLNQLGDHGHYIGTEEKYSKTDNGIWLGDKFLSFEDLGYNAAKKTQYLKNNCLKFKLFLKVNTL